MFYFAIDLLCAIIVTIILIYHNEKTVIKDVKSRFFLSLVIIVYITLLVEVLLYLNNIFLESTLALSILLCIYYSIFYAVAYVLFAFIFLYIFEDIKKSYLIYIPACIFSIIGIILVIINGSNGTFYTVHDLTYELNSGFLLMYIVPSIYAVMIFATIFLSGHRVSKTVKIALYTVFLTSAVIMIPQWLLHKNGKSLFLLGSWGTIIYLLLYLYIQNKRGIFDELTGLCKRKIFMKKIRLLDSKHDKVIIALIDLTNFKAINSKYGQERGDEFIQQVSLYLKTSFGASNTFRFGGDEFALVLRKSSANLDKIDSIVQRFREPFVIDGFSAIIPIHVGVVEYPKYVPSVEDLCIILEELIKDAKEKAEVVAICDDTIVNEIRNKHKMLNILIKTIENDAVEVYYQPIYSIEKKGFYNAEALIRIRNDGKILSPGQFIDIAEETGLVVDLDLIVFRKVLLFFKKLEALGVEIDGISTNFTAQHFINPHFSDEILEMVKTFGVNPDKIKMEITESSFVSNLLEAQKVINKLTKKGIRFYLDDFGTGYSSWATILNLPFDFIKIDRSLVVNGDLNNKGLVILRATIGALSANGQDVLTEGVETINQLDMVRNLGTKYVQGYYYSKPMPQDEFVEFLKNQGKKPEKDNEEKED